MFESRAKSIKRETFQNGFFEIWDDWDPLEPEMSRD